jgi:thiamine biosynthesis protein ThiC
MTCRDRDDEMSYASDNFDWNRQFRLTLDLERAKESYGKTLPADIYKTLISAQSLSFGGLTNL